MTSTKQALACAAAVLALAMGTVGAEAKSCRQAGGLSQMPTKALAEFMAEAALKNAIAAHGWTAAGPISMKCKDDTFTTTCTARRLACN
jgi:hypothetical protein